MTTRPLAKGFLLITFGAALGWLISTQTQMPHEMPTAQSGGDGPCAGGAPASHWAAPMDPSYQRDGPGKSPMGMDLVPVCPGGDSASGADVTIDPAIVQNLGLRTATAERRALSREIKAVGTVSYDEDSFEMIHARAEGWLERLQIESEGAAVKAGEPLYSLFSPKLVAAEREYLTARDSGRTGLIRAAEDRLQALGYSADQIESLRSRGKPAQQLRRIAREDGVVAMLGVRDGQFIAPGTHMMTLASLTTVWVLVDLLERDAGLVHQGQAASATFDAYPGREWNGKVDYVYPSLDSATRTAKVRLVFDNGDGALRPNMFARASIHTAAQADAVTIPTAAVIRGGHGDRVVKRVGDGAFEVLPIHTGLHAGDVVQVLEGLSAGDEIVISGQFLLDSEANLDAEALRMKALKPQGKAQGRITELDRTAGTITLAHGPITPTGENGLTIPGMTMPFELATNSEGFQPGDEVEVTISQPGQGRYQITEMQASMGSGSAPGDHAHVNHGGDDEHPGEHAGAPAAMEHPGEHAGPAMGSAHASSQTRGRVVAVDQKNRHLTLEHDAIESVGMPAMTMPFPVVPGIDLSTLKKGDELRFRIDEQSFSINDLEVRK